MFAFTGLEETYSCLRRNWGGEGRWGERPYGGEIEGAGEGGR